MKRIVYQVHIVCPNGDHYDIRYIDAMGFADLGVRIDNVMRDPKLAHKHVSYINCIGELE